MPAGAESDQSAHVDDDADKPNFFGSQCIYR